MVNLPATAVIRGRGSGNLEVQSGEGRPREAPIPLMVTVSAPDESAFRHALTIVLQQFQAVKEVYAELRGVPHEAVAPMFVVGEASNEAWGVLRGEGTSAPGGTAPAEGLLPGGAAPAEGLLPGGAAPAEGLMPGGAAPALLPGGAGQRDHEANKPTNLPTNQPTNQPTNHPTSLRQGQPTNQPASQPTANQPTTYVRT